MFAIIRKTIAPASLALALISCASPAKAQTVSTHPNSIQPETTLNISAEASIPKAPDIAFVSAGVETEGETAAAALALNAERMNGVFDALKRAGIRERNIQTSNFSVSPRYAREENRSRQIDGYTARNTVTAKVTDLKNLGATIDSLVQSGGNTLNGVTFGLEDDTDVLDEARREAIKTAIERAELYADAAGYRIARIVSINESGRSSGPRPMAMMARSAEAAPSPVSGGELDFGAAVNVQFELEKR